MKKYLLILLATVIMAFIYIFSTMLAFACLPGVVGQGTAISSSPPSPAPASSPSTPSVSTDSSGGENPNPNSVSVPPLFPIPPSVDSYIQKGYHRATESELKSLGIIK